VVRKTYGKNATSVSINGGGGFAPFTGRWKRFILGGREQEKGEASIYGEKGGDAAFDVRRVDRNRRLVQKKG